MTSTDGWPSEASAELDRQLRAIEASPGLSAPSATKYKPLEKWLGDALGIGGDAIRSVWMDTAGAFTARRGTIASARPRLGVILVGEGVDRIVERSKDLVQQPTECILVSAKDNGAWNVAALVASQGSSLADEAAALFGVPDERRYIVGPVEASLAGSVAASPPVATLLPEPSFTREDCELLERYSTSTRWSDVPASDQDSYAELRTRHQQLVSAVQARTNPALTMAAHTSMRNVRSYAAKDMWCCVFPASAPNKSYALQVAFIVSPAGAELCFCLGSGSAMERVEEHRESNRAAFRALQARLAGLPGSERDVLKELATSGWDLRRGWRQSAGGQDFSTVDEWLAFASSADGGGASISRNVTVDELEDRGSAIVDDLVELTDKVFPVFAFAYDFQPAIKFDLATLVEECSARLRLPLSVYENIWAALESGKHVILTGPPGTGKTTLAQTIAEIAARSRRSAGWVLSTATSDWTTFETIGGLRPSPEGLQFEEGHFLEAIRERKWLIIDELNRSNFDRAFGQLFTLLSDQPVVLPYRRPLQDERLTLVPEPAERFASLAGDQLLVPKSWRIIATVNVFDKSLLFEMSYALMRRFAFIEVPSPDDEAFGELIGAAALDYSGERDDVAIRVAKSLMGVRDVKDIGPASYLDLTRFVTRLRQADSAIPEQELAWRAFYAYLLPQFEGVDEREGKSLYQTLARIVGPDGRPEVRRTLRAVLGISSFAVAPVASADADEAEAQEEE